MNERFPKHEYDNEDTRLTEIKSKISSLKAVLYNQIIYYFILVVDFNRYRT